MIPVEVVDVMDAARPLVLRGPGGVVVEGSVDEIAALLRRLQS